MDEEILNEGLESFKSKPNNEDSKIGETRMFGNSAKYTSINNREKECVIGRGLFWCYKCDFFFPDEKSLCYT